MEEKITAIPTVGPQISVSSVILQPSPSCLAMSAAVLKCQIIVIKVDVDASHLQMQYVLM